jgi:hypothetical protein
MYMSLPCEELPILVGRFPCTGRDGDTRTIHIGARFAKRAAYDGEIIRCNLSIVCRSRSELFRYQAMRLDCRNMNLFRL